MMLHGTNTWNFDDYQPIGKWDEHPIVVTRIVPDDEGFLLSWRDPGQAGGGYTVRWHDVEGVDHGSCAVNEAHVHVSGLREGHTYEVTVSGARDGAASQPRLLRCGDAPGTIVNYLHPRDGAYGFSGRFLASPSLVVLPSGRLLVSMDVFEWHGGQNLTVVFLSEDHGRSWHYLTQLFPCFWGAMFVSRGTLYMLAMATEYGDLLLGASHDEGKTWSAPVPLFRSSANGAVGGLHKAPTPVVEANGRIVTAIDYGSWETGGFRQAILSCDVQADPMDPESWRLSSLCDPRKGLLDDEGISGGGLEGNVLVGPGMEIYDMLRLQIDSSAGNPHPRALLLRADPSLGSLHYVRTVPYGGGNNAKFFALYDPVSGKYWAAGNEPAPGHPDARNVLALSCSDDLTDFKPVCCIVDGSSGDPRFVAAQYPSMAIDGDDLLVVSRTAANDADSYHNSNYITFHVVKDFRSCGQMAR